MRPIAKRALARGFYTLCCVSVAMIEELLLVGVTAHHTSSF